MNCEGWEMAAGSLWPSREATARLQACVILARRHSRWCWIPYFVGTELDGRFWHDFHDIYAVPYLHVSIGALPRSSGRSAPANKLLTPPAAHKS